MTVSIGDNFLFLKQISLKCNKGNNIHILQRNFNKTFFNNRVNKIFLVTLFSLN